MKPKAINIVFFTLLSFLTLSCVKFENLYKEKDPESGQVGGDSAYIYPFKNESQNSVAEITIQTDGSIDLSTVDAEIPYLKYNKSWLFLLTQDDCKQAAYCCTWAAIHGKPLSNDFFYDAAHLKAGDLPPDIYYLEKTLGSSDGAGNEVRFSFTTTLAPELDWMNAETVVNLGFTDNYYRFYLKSGLVWNNVIEMLNYGVGIAFHDVETSDVNNPDSIRMHYEVAQKIILDRFSGRGCKILAEPNGNKTYVAAAETYDPIQVMTAQAGASTLYPFKVKDDLQKQLLERFFNDDPEKIKEPIVTQLKLKKEDRAAIHVGVHGTNYAWVNLLVWLNNTYGKDGDDSVWVPNMEEYYEYNYYRIHGSITKTVTNNVLKITVNLPSDQYFYYPSVTINLKGLKKENITSISSNNSVTGLSHGNYENGVMLNIDCRKFLLEHATHFVEQYEGNKTSSNLNDATYFVSMLKDSDEKRELLERIE